ncbi:MAG: aspartate/glutamate racemase family protein [Proteobacteria bacterium]|nr:aspartate/glutamate racemase family protein [Pseudomonadota bacterium]
MPRIALIHALRHSPPPIEAAFRELWPEPRLMNLLDDSLSADLARDGTITRAMTQRFLDLAGYARRTGADAILFTCSAFGPCIDAVKAANPNIPVLKPNEAMIEQAATLGGRIGLLATFEPTLRSMPGEFPDHVVVKPTLAAAALTALDGGDRDEHDRLATNAAAELANCDVIALAQFSLSSAAPLIAARYGRPVLTTPHSAVRKLRSLLVDPGGNAG